MSEFVCIFLISHEHKWLPNITRCEIWCEIRSSLCSTYTEWVMCKQTCVTEELTCIFCLICCTTSVSHSPLCACFSRFKPESVFVASLIWTKTYTDPYTHKHTHTSLIQTQVGPCPTVSSPGPQVFTDSCSIHKSGSSLVFLSIHS